MVFSTLPMKSMYKDLRISGVTCFQRADLSVTEQVCFETWMHTVKRGLSLVDDALNFQLQLPTQHFTINRFGLEYSTS